MNWFKNRNTLTKLMLGFSLLALMIGFVGYRGVTSMGAVDHELEMLYTRDMAGLTAIKEANISLLAIGRAARAAILNDHKTEGDRIDQHTQLVEKSLANMAAQLTATEKTLVSDKAKDELAKARAALVEYQPQIREVMRLARAGEDIPAQQLITRIRPLADSLDQYMSDIGSSKEQLCKKAYEDANAVYDQARTIMLATVFGAVVLALALGIFLARLVSAPLSQAVEVLREVANGDLTCSLNVTTQDEIGLMASALNQAIASMRDTMQQVTAAATNVSTAAQQLSSASEELSSGAQEQASSQEETSATMEELSSTVKRNAENAVQANQLATAARDTASGGGEVVSAAVNAMSEINSASKRIADIITTIDEIAFQTNLLALNAAVEAARAGEQGRGFAVVASEVRNLAQRSAASAKEIKGLIQDSVRKVETGSELVNRSGKSLTEIVGSVKRVTDIVAEIAAASREQASGIDQVGKAMEQMDQVTQQNSAQTEELSSTAQGLATQAEQLQGLVAQFVVDDNRRSRPSANHPPPPARTSLPGRKRPANPSSPRSEAALGQLARQVSDATPAPGSFVEY